MHPVAMRWHEYQTRHAVFIASSRTSDTVHADVAALRHATKRGRAMRGSRRDVHFSLYGARCSAAALFAVAATFGAGAANADPIVQTTSLPSTASDWSNDFTFQQFDPSEGTLNGVGLTLQSTLTGSVAYESREAAPSTITAGFNGSVVTTRPDGTYLTSVAPMVSTTANFAATDGTVDFAGPSGGTASGLSASASATTSGTFTPADAALFTGKGTIALPVAAQVRATETGPANLVARFNAQVSASATLTYDFVAPGQTSSGGSTGSTFLTGNTSTIGAVSAGSVTTGPQIVKVADKTTGWSSAVGFQKFNPALGTLEAVNLTITSDVAAKQGFENLGATATSISASQSAALTLALKSGTLLSVVTTLSGVESLARFDGSVDFAGASGSTSKLSGSDTNATGLFDQADLTAFTGSGSILLDLSATGTSSAEGPGNMMLDLAEQAGATIDLTYTYVPGADPADSAADPVPEPGSLAVFGVSLAFAGLGARRSPRSRQE